MNSMATVMSLIANRTNSIANRMNSIAKVMNLIVKICTIVLLSKDRIIVHVYATKDATFKIILTSNGTDKRYNINTFRQPDIDFFLIAILLCYA